jgi:hypothetical protein
MPLDPSAAAHRWPDHEETRASYAVRCRLPILRRLLRGSDGSQGVFKSSRRPLSAFHVARNPIEALP